jgi:hypothetical protein
MDEFPFTDSDWLDIQDAARGIVEAAHADDPEERAAQFARLQSILNRLRGWYGEHPILLETEADFMPDAAAAVDLYRRAEQLAVDHHLPALSARLSLARLLVEELDRPAEAREVLAACQTDLPMAHQDDCATWTALFTRCGA